MNGLVLGWQQPDYAWFWRALMIQLSGRDATPQTRQGVFIVEDHSGMRRALRRLVERSPGFYVTGEAASAEEALEQFAAETPSLVLVDINLPGMNGIDLIATITAQSRVKCVVISAYAEPERVRAAFAAGARAFVSKDEPYKIASVLTEVAEDRGAR